MDNFRKLDPEEIKKLSSKERRAYLKELANHNSSDSIVTQTKESYSLISETSKKIVDLDINLIDADEKNEELFGYEDLDKIEESFDKIGNKSIINVYERENGRYVCYSGNQRLILSKKRGAKTITCYIDGPEPDEETKFEALLAMNRQRTIRPYYMAKLIVEKEKFLRKEGVNNISEEIEKEFYIQERMQRAYKQILKLDPSLQKLFVLENVPLKSLLNACAKIPVEKTDIFVDTIKEKLKSDSFSSDLINEALKEISANDKEKTKSIVRAKSSQVFKTIMSLPYFSSEEEIVIPEKKKQQVLEQIDELEDYLKRLKKACK